MKKRPNGERQGVALIMTLAFILMITVIIVGFTLSMRTDRPAANTFLEKTRAGQFAQMGVDMVVGNLQRYTGATNALGTAGSTNSPWWISQPGQLVVAPFSQPANMAGAAVVPLSSGQSTYSTTVQSLQPANLNILSLANSSNQVITGTPDPSHSNPDTTANITKTNPTGSTIKMLAKWVYVHSDGTLDTSEPPTLNSNPIIGRYAYWADDESTKMNYNLAWGRATTGVSGNTNSIGQPTVGLASDVNLQALVNFSSGMANAVHSCGPFNTPEDARAMTTNSAITGISTSLQNNQFEITHYNHDTDVNCFGETRIVLTTQPERAGWTWNGSQWVGINGLSGAAGLPRFLDLGLYSTSANVIAPAGLPILTGPLANLTQAQQGALAALAYPSKMDLTAGGSVERTVNMLMSYLKRKDWPMAPGTTFDDTNKYPGGLLANGTLDPSVDSEAGIAQIAMNIVDYVRSKECTVPIVVPLGGGCVSGNYAATVSGSGTATLYKQLRGMSRTPLLTEMGFAVFNETGPQPGGPPFTGDPWTNAPKLEVYSPKNYNLVRSSAANIPLSWILITGNGVFTATSGALYYAVNSYGGGPYATSPNASVDGTGYGFSYWKGSGGDDASDTVVTSGVISPGDYVVFKWLPNSTGIYNGNGVPQCSYLPIYTATGTKPWTSLNKGNYTYVGFGLMLNDDATLGQTKTGNQVAFESCPLPNTTSIVANTTASTQTPSLIEYQFDNKGTTPAISGSAGLNKDCGNISSLELDDPRMGSTAADWVQSASGNTFGLPNSRYSVGKAANLAIPQPPGTGAQLDTDASGNITEASLYMPPPAGLKGTYPSGMVSDNTLGVITSVGELGFICTGRLGNGSSCNNQYGTRNASALTANRLEGYPWRTIRLQPNSRTSTAEVPDWALLDIFTAPSPGVAGVTSALFPSQIYNPHGTSTGGRVNLNSADATFGLQRTLPLAGVLYGADANTGAGGGTASATNAISATTAVQLASNIDYAPAIPACLASGMGNTGKLYGGYTGGYAYPGEIVEVKGIADTGEDSEELVREIYSLVTTRGDVFSIYSVGQSIKQTSNGSLIITGEQRLQSMVERYVDPNTGSIRFAPVYYKNLTP